MMSIQADKGLIGTKQTQSGKTRRDCTGWLVYTLRSGLDAPRRHLIIQFRPLLFFLSFGYILLT